MGPDFSACEDCPVLFPFTGRKCFTARTQEGGRGGKRLSTQLHTWPGAISSPAGPASPSLYQGMSNACLP